jgi:hypothetical protein
MCGLAAVNRFPRERMFQDEGNRFWRAEVGEPLPGEGTCHGHDQAIAVGSNGLEEGFRSSWHIAVQQQLTIVAQDADVHGPGM